MTMKNYLIQFWSCIFAYLLSIFLMNKFYSELTFLNVILSSFPIICVIYLGLVFLKFVWSLDELWRKIISEAGAFSGLVTGLICLSYGFIENMGAPIFQAWWAWIILNVVYVAAVFVLRFRYC